MGIKLRKDHGQNFPTIRISGVELENFKSVKKGQVIFNCGRKHIPYGTESDILGIYGQNGSGKTSLIEAISILKHALTGDAIPDSYADCIDVSSEYATLTFTFDIQYPINNQYPTNGDIRKVVYSFKMAKEVKETVESPRIYVDEELDVFIPVSQYRVRIFDEIIKVGGSICGEKQVLKPFLDTSKKKILEPATKIKLLVGTLDEDKRIQIGTNKMLASKQSQSFLFMREMMELYSDNSDYSVYYQMMVELRYWGQRYLYVVDSKSTGIVSSGVMLPIFTGEDMELIPIGKRFTVSNEAYEDMCKCMDSLDLVLTQIVPGLTVAVKDYGKALIDGNDGHSVELIARRGTIEIPLRCESEGVRKIVSTLYYLIGVYNKKSMTVAYDEFDAGIFEYLLGEILQVIQTSGKGQFIFTSHNMRPLEVLKKDYIWFTTTDPEERYIRLAGLGETNNLRRVYYREIAMHENYDNLYNETKRNMIISAMRKAGGC